MSRTERSLRAIVLNFLGALLCTISPLSSAWQGDKISPFVGMDINGKKCAGIQISFCPFDYLQRDKFPDQLATVEESHLKAHEENLGAGLTSASLKSINYVLMAWPNHHSALHSVLNYRLQHLGNWPEDSGVLPAECYLQRAINFSPKDPKPYIMYGVLLQKVKQFDKALNAYRSANRLLPNDVMTQYNMGMTLVALKKYKEAAQLAQKVYSAGFPLPALKNKLIAAGHWTAGADESVSNTAKQELSPAQLEAIKNVMQNEAARKKASPEAAAP